MEFVPQKEDLRFVRGDDVRVPLVLRGGGVPLDLTGCRLDLTVRRRADDGVLLHLSSDDGGIVISDDGGVLLVFAHANTAGAKWSTAMYDLQLTDSAGRRTTVLCGFLFLNKDITEV